MASPVPAKIEAFSRALHDLCHEHEVDLVGLVRRTVTLPDGSERSESATVAFGVTLCGAPTELVVYASRQTAGVLTRDAAAIEAGASATPLTGGVKH